MATTDTKYNGWTNYETWNVALWLGNDSGSYEYWREVTQACWNDAVADKILTRLERAAHTLADRLKDEIEEANPLADQPSMFSDLLGAAISEVDWDEIANNWLEDCDKDDEEEPEYV